MKWFYARNSQQSGPITQEELDQLAQNGTITPETLVWREGMAGWQPYDLLRRSPPPPSISAFPPFVDQVPCAECQRSFSRNDLIHYENLFVCATCKPVFFQKLKEGITPGGQAGGWRSGNFLVMRKDATLPDRCVKCNADASGEKLTRKLFWHHPALYLLILPGLLIYAIVATIVGKRAKIQIGLCHEHRQRRKRNLIIAWVLFLTSILAFILGGMLSNGWIVGFRIVALIVSPVYGLITCPMVTPKKIDDQYVWLKGVSPKYLETLPAFPGPR